MLPALTSPSPPVSVMAPEGPDRHQALAMLTGFRARWYGCLATWTDELFELTDALLCAPGAVRCPVELSLEPEHRRGHGTLYAALNRGRLAVGRLRWALAVLPLPRLPAAGGRQRLVLAVDVSPWLRPDAACSPGRSFCHLHGRRRDEHRMIPGWPYSIIAALETGRTCWTAVLDAVRLDPDADVAAVSAQQVRDLVVQLIETGQHRGVDADILVVFDAGYDTARLAFLLADLPVEVLGRLRADRVLRRPAPSREQFNLANPYGGRYPKHGGEFRFTDPATWHAPDQVTTTATARYGVATAQAWDRLHHRLTRRAAWIDHDADLPVISGTLIRLEVERLPNDSAPKPMWLWSSAAGLTAEAVDRLWQAFLRRFDLEHTFRFWKQTLGWTAPRLRSPEAADTWTWIIIAAHTQLRLSRHLVEDLRRPWEHPGPPGRLSPARVRRGFRNIRPQAGSPARAPKPCVPGPGRPLGSHNRHRAPHYELGKVLKRPKSLAAKQHH